MASAPKTPDAIIVGSPWAYSYDSSTYPCWWIWGHCSSRCRFDFGSYRRGDGRRSLQYSFGCGCASFGILSLKWQCTYDGPAKWDVGLYVYAFQVSSGRMRMHENGPADCLGCAAAWRVPSGTEQGFVPRMPGLGSWCSGPLTKVDCLSQGAWYISSSAWREFRSV